MSLWVAGALEGAFCNHPLLVSRVVAVMRARAREAVRESMLAAGIPGFDAILGRGGTAHFLGGDLWPDREQLQQIELSLGWPYGTIKSIVDRPPYEALSGTEHALVGMIHTMPEADRRALIELLKVTKMRAQANAREDIARQAADDLRTITGEIA